MPADRPQKRIFTQSASESSLTWRSPNDAQNDEITARLQNVASRVRKSVMEGYATDKWTPTTPGYSPTTTQPAGTPRIFQSAKDTLREVYSSSSDISVHHSSSNKRGRARSEEPEGPDNSSEKHDVEMDFSGSGSDASALSPPPGPELRPTKPLKRLGRQFAQTRSLPAGSLFSGSGNDSQSIFPSTGLDSTKSIEEEDWSDVPSFASASKFPTLDTNI